MMAKNATKKFGKKKNYKYIDPKRPKNPSTRNLRKTIPRHILIKLLKTKRLNVKSNQRGRKGMLCKKMGENKLCKQK